MSSPDMKEVQGYLQVAMYDKRDPHVTSKNRREYTVFVDAVRDEELEIIKQFFDITGIDKEVPEHQESIVDKEKVRIKLKYQSQKGYNQ